MDSSFRILCLLLVIVGSCHAFPFLWPSFGRSKVTTVTTTTHTSGPGPHHPHGHSHTTSVAGALPHSSHLHVRPEISSHLNTRPFPPLVGAHHHHQRPLSSHTHGGLGHLHGSSGLIPSGNPHHHYHHVHHPHPHSRVLHTHIHPAALHYPFHSA